MSEWKYGAPVPLQAQQTQQVPQPAPVYYQPAPQYQMEPVPVAPTPIPDSEFFLCCDCCGEAFELDEPAVELFYGKAGRGEKSGQPMIVEDPLVSNPTVSLHEWCVAQFANTFLYDDGDSTCPMCGHAEAETECCECGGDLICSVCGRVYVVNHEPRFCAGCEAKLSGD